MFQNGYTSLVVKLLKAGAETEAKDEEGWGKLWDMK